MDRGGGVAQEARDHEQEVGAPPHYQQAQRAQQAPSAQQQRRGGPWRAMFPEEVAQEWAGPGEQVEEFGVDAEDATDTTAEEAAMGRDLQGIPWNNLHFTRENYRRQRLSAYNNYGNLLNESCQQTQQRLASTCAAPRRDGCFYPLQRNWRSVQSSIMHFQLRNLVWATSAHDVYVVCDNCVHHWSPITRHTTEVLNLRGPPRGPWLPGVGRVQISTLCVKHGVVAAGGFTGELVVKVLGREGVAWSGRVCQTEDGITNGIEIFDSERLGFCMLTSNNDNHVRLFDVGTMAPKAHFRFPWAVNGATLRPNSGTFAAVGDDPVALLVDVNSGMQVMRLQGHLDFSFAAAWHPDGNLLATGNQDCTTIVWDVRQPAAPLVQLPGRMGAIRSLRFSPDGRFLCASEPADFVHIYDIAKEGAQEQEIDLFGEVAGISFTPDGRGLFVGVSDATYSSMLQFRRHTDSRLVPEAGPLTAPLEEWPCIEAAADWRRGGRGSADAQRGRRRALDRPRQHQAAAEYVGVMVGYEDDSSTEEEEDEYDVGGATDADGD